MSLEQEPEEVIWGGRLERSLGLTLNFLTGVLLAALAFTSVHAVNDSMSSAERAYFADIPTEEAAKLFQDVPTNPNFEEFLLALQKKTGSKPLEPATCDIDGFYIYQAPGDYKIAQNTIDVSDPNYDAVEFLQTQEAIDDGWVPVAIYELPKDLSNPIYKSDGSLDTESAVYQTYEENYLGAWAYLTANYGACGYSRGDTYLTDEQLFGRSTGYGAYGFNTLWVKVED